MKWKNQARIHQFSWFINQNSQHNLLRWILTDFEIPTLQDLHWGLFLNKYIFPGADASTPLGFYIDRAESAGFEIKSVDTIGVHYSATLWRWYRNWLGNREKVEAKYGKRWFRVCSKLKKGFLTADTWLTKCRFGSTSWHYLPLLRGKALAHVTRSQWWRISTRRRGLQEFPPNFHFREHWQRNEVRSPHRE